MFTGDEIKRMRKQQNISAIKLAHLLNVKVENLYKWEKGHRPTDPTDYIKIESWLSGKLENVPRDTVSTGNNLDTPKELPWQIIDRLSKGIENITEANLLLAKRISSDGSGPTSLPVQEERKGSGVSDVKLSGKKR